VLLVYDNNKHQGGFQPTLRINDNE